MGLLKNVVILFPTLLLDPQNQNLQEKAQECLQRFLVLPVPPGGAEAQKGR